MSDYFDCVHVILDRSDQECDIHNIFARYMLGVSKGVEVSQGLVHEWG